MHSGGMGLYVLRARSLLTYITNRSIVSFVYCTLYGISSTPSSISIPDHIVKDFEDMTADMTRSATPGAYLVDIFPSMMILPTWLARFKQEGAKWFKRRTGILESLIDDVQEGVVSLAF